MTKVIVLGSNGQLGKTIQDFADSDTTQYSFYTRKDLDITDKNSLEEAFKHSDFDYCINCAAYTNVENAETNIEEAFLINAVGARNIAEACAINQVKLIHISTDYVFNGEKRIPYGVNDNTQPINQYGKSKLQGELYIKEQLKEHYIIRTSWLYSLHGKNFLKSIIGKIENNVILNITTEEEGTPTSCIDLAEFVLYIVKTDTMPYGFYNFSAKGSTTWFGFAKEIARNLNPQKQDLILPTEKFETLAKRPKYSVLNLNRTKEFYKKINTWQNSLSIMLSHYKSQRS